MANHFTAQCISLLRLIFWHWAFYDKFYCSSAKLLAVSFNILSKIRFTLDSIFEVGYIFLSIELMFFDFLPDQLKTYIVCQCIDGHLHDIALTFIRIEWTDKCSNAIYNTSKRKISLIVDEGHFLGRDCLLVWRFLSL